MTLKDEKGGIAAVLVDEGFNMRDLKVGPPDRAPEKANQTRFTVAFRHTSPNFPASYAPPMRSGTYSVFVSVGRRDGTPEIALPLPKDDGQRRYRLGTIKVDSSK
jgi:hypothetical protein